MKKNLLTIAAILIIAITFGGTSYAQFGDLINKAKDAAKKKEKKAETKPTEQTNGNGQSTETKDDTKEGKARRIQNELMTVEPSDVGKIYFSNKPFTTNHEGSKTTFTSGEYIYGRLD